MVIMTPLIGWRRRYFEQQADTTQPLLGILNLLALLRVGGLAVSSRTASLVNHQSQLRVPPMPRRAVLLEGSASGKLQAGIDQRRGFTQRPVR